MGLQSYIGAIFLKEEKAVHTFELLGDSSEGDLAILQLFQEDFSVTASSALCYGLEEAIKRFVALLIYGSYRRKTLESVPVISNPCLSPRYL